jgi:predicted alpha/beta-hydrolase family hydrolase
MSVTVCFCHGRESGPWGTKIRRLALVAEQFGCRVVSVDDRDTQDPEERVRRLLSKRAELGETLILVGSSMGGYVAAVAAAELHPIGLFLLAPAIGLPGYRIDAPHIATSRLCIVHGWDDSVVPLANVQAFALSQRASLHILADGHTLQNSLEQIARLFADFLADSLGRNLPQPARELVAAL